MNLLSSLLPQYQCHKVVRAAKIASIDEPSLTLEKPIPASTAQPAGVARFGIEPVAGFFAKHRPEVGGYFVLYEDGYQSYSPAKAFEEGYSLQGN